jgi:hypothetical protein
MYAPPDGRSPADGGRYMPSEREKTVIQVFLRRYNAKFGRTYRIIGWPEEIEREKRLAGPGETIDALAVDSNGRTLALEHTIIEAFEDAMTSDSRFEPLISALKTPSMKVPGHHIIVYMPLASMDGMTAREREAFAQEFAAWFDGIRLTLPEGMSDENPVLRGRPFAVRLYNRRLGDDHPGRVTVQRYPQPDFPPRLRRAVEDKLPKLLGFQADERVLLLERRDDDTPNSFQVHRCLKGLEGSCDLARLSEVWLADTAALVFGDCAGSGPYVEFTRVWPTVDGNWFREQVSDSEMKAVQSER